MLHILNTWQLSMQTHWRQSLHHNIFMQCFCMSAMTSSELCASNMHCFAVYVTHPSSFTLVFNRLLSVWYCPLHIVYWVLHIVLYAIYHFPLGEVSYRGGVEDMQTGGGKMEPDVKAGERGGGGGVDTDGAELRDTGRNKGWKRTIEGDAERGKRGITKQELVSRLWVLLLTRLLAFLNFLHFGMFSFASSTYSCAPTTLCSMLFTSTPCTKTREKVTVVGLRGKIGLKTSA